MERAVLRRAHVRGMVPEGWGSRACPSARPKGERCPLSAIGPIWPPTRRDDPGALVLDARELALGEDDGRHPLVTVYSSNT
eukprot:scaffold70993_cov68-Phaeocystis_antarctica.AAC.2